MENEIEKEFKELIKSIELYKEKIICGAYKVIFIINKINFEIEKELNNHSNYVYSLLINKNILISGSYEINIFDLNRYELKYILNTNNVMVNSLVLYNDLLISGLEDNNIIIYQENEEKYEEKNKFQIEKSVCSLRKYNNLLYLGTYKYILIYKIQENYLISNKKLTHEKFEDFIYCLLKWQNYLIVNSKNYLFVINENNNEIINEIESNQNEYFDSILIFNNKLITSAGKNIIFYKIKDNKIEPELIDIFVEDNIITSLFYTNNLLIYSYNGFLKIIQKDLNNTNTTNHSNSNITITMDLSSKITTNSSISNSLSFIYTRPNNQILLENFLKIFQYNILRQKKYILEKIRSFKNKNYDFLKKKEKLLKQIINNFKDNNSKIDEKIKNYKKIKLNFERKSKLLNDKLNELDN